MVTVGEMTAKAMGAHLPKDCSACHPEEDNDKPFWQSFEGKVSKSKLSKLHGSETELDFQNVKLVPRDGIVIANLSRLC
jgi:hypothetical protein